MPFPGPRERALYAGFSGARVHPASTRLPKAGARLLRQLMIRDLATPRKAYISTVPGTPAPHGSGYPRRITARIAAVILTGRNHRTPECAIYQHPAHGCSACRAPPTPQDAPPDRGAQPDVDGVQGRVAELDHGGRRVEGRRDRLVPGAGEDRRPPPRPPSRTIWERSVRHPVSSWAQHPTGRQTAADGPQAIPPFRHTFPRTKIFPRLRRSFRITP